MLKPNDLPLLCLPVDLSDEAAAKLIEFLYEFTETLESHYCGALTRYYRATQHHRGPSGPSDSVGPVEPVDPTDPPF